MGVFEHVNVFAHIYGATHSRERVVQSSAMKVVNPRGSNRDKVYPADDGSPRSRSFESDRVVTNGQTRGSKSRAAGINEFSEGKTREREAKR